MKDLIDKHLIKGQYFINKYYKEKHQDNLGFETYIESSLNSNLLKEFAKVENVPLMIDESKEGTTYIKEVFVFTRKSLQELIDRVTYANFYNPGRITL